MHIFKGGSTSEAEAEECGMQAEYEDSIVQRRSYAMRDQSMVQRR